jgi:hypothetical protein
MNNYAGIDPGRNGGLALIEADNTIRVWPMPEKQERGVNVEDVIDIIRSWPLGTIAGLEYNMGRPGEVPDYAFRFGLQTGQLDGTLRGLGIAVTHIYPQAWMKRLGLTGKRDDPKLHYRRKLLEKIYPHATRLVIGPKGGVKDGILEAILIAHYHKEISESKIGRWGRNPPKCRGLEPDVPEA